jgi:alkaline phosphatase
MLLRRLVPLIFAFTSLAAAGQPRAKNVVLFIGDAGGIATLHAASVYKYNEAQQLFIQRMPHIALSDTSTSAQWVSDSAAGMSAIVTGQKTLNGVVSQTPPAVAGQDGEWLQTILEEAEERGLSTGIVTNMAITDATPAACYAHVNLRSKSREIVDQLLAPRFGDGVDALIGAPPALKGDVEGALAAEARMRLEGAGYTVLPDLAVLPPKEARRIAAFIPNGNFALQAAIDIVVPILKRNPRGYFLMVEWDMHTNQLKRGLDRVVELDAAVARTAATAGRDTLILFTADHSYDLRMRGGNKGEPVLEETTPDTAVVTNGAAARPPVIRVDDGHTGEQVLAAAQGPGSEAVRGFIVNTDLYRIMRSAYGWDRTPVGGKPAK